MGLGTVEREGGMVKLEWKDWFNIGIEKIDFEHRIFLGLVQAVDASVAANESSEKIRRALEEIYKYADFHFLSEENVMIDAGFDGYTTHKRMHQELLADLRKWIADSARNPDDTIMLVTFLYEWFANHTVSEDGKIADFMKRASPPQ